MILTMDISGACDLLAASDVIQTKQLDSMMIHIVETNGSKKVIVQSSTDSALNAVVSL